MCQPVVVRRRTEVGVYILAQSTLKSDVQFQARVRYVADERVVSGVRQLTGWAREVGLARVDGCEVQRLRARCSSGGGGSLR